LASQETKDQLVAFLPNLRAFAIYLCSDPEYADDLVQETILKAWAHLDSFTDGTKLRSWLFTILRNTYFSAWRRHQSGISIDDINDYSDGLGVDAEQEKVLEQKDMLLALARLPLTQRTAILLVGAEGFTYQEAAQICDCAVGTIKSRVNRARCTLNKLLNEERVDTFLAADRALNRKAGDEVARAA
jgi:RNA polymerase sigma-70 factor, ECF subfamily